MKVFLVFIFQALFIQNILCQTTRGRIFFNSRYKVEELNLDVKSLQDNPVTMETYFSSNINSTMRLGSGFSSYHIDEVKQNPFTYEIDSVDGVGSLSTNFEVSLVFNRSQLIKSLDYDAKLDIRVFALTGSAFAKVINKSDFTETSLMLVIKGETEYGRKTLKNLKLTTEANGIIKDIPKFVKIYGNKYPIIMRHGASVYFILDISNISEEIKNTFRSELTLKKSILNFSAELKANLQKEITKANNENRLNIQILTKGGAGLEGLGDIITSIKQDSSSFDDIKDKLGKYFNSFNFSNSAPLGYFVADYNELGLTIPNSLFLQKREKALETIKNKYYEAEDSLDFLQLIVSNIHPLSQMITKDEKDKIVKEYIPAILIYEDTLLAYHKRYSDLILEQTAYKIPIFSYAFNFPETDITIMTELKNPNEPDLRQTDLQYIVKGDYLTNVYLEYRSSFFTTKINPKDFIATTPFFYNATLMQTINQQHGYTFIQNDRLVLTKGAIEEFINARPLWADIDKSRAISGTVPVDLYIFAINKIGVTKSYKIATIFPTSPFESGQGLKTQIFYFKTFD